MGFGRSCVMKFWRAFPRMQLAAAGSFGGVLVRVGWSCWPPIVFVGEEHRALVPFVNGVSDGVV